ncbi:Uncharacterised protein (plasmid) [Tsukamurella tyrosinosolvens]|uniref:Uncharacterized protein n=1 Tax=Tsukamurella tyrosinosolvens TaxID=57704 RepID=A0A1H4UHT7_TSUTY|nr:hypothetical protein [Tsukamurella tyrosinosolvens]KXO92924.1 hypothetical protein AXK58_13715 [Tsukamurella tyrosinosolvens]SEC67851.1 hypothetical protein SAMN04489793_2895 [Tsukamurella tyrosinosolvens]VEH94211.1 Uncharacterised protein [Tsukamurella tyrosinosolvens]
MRTTPNTAHALARAAHDAELPADLLGTALILLSALGGVFLTPALYPLFPLALVLPVVVRLIGGAARGADLADPRALREIAA